MPKSKTNHRKSHLGSRRQPEVSRAAILQAAVEEFARDGIAGARTDAIAHAAHVNKALLYYYFKDKEDLYQAVLDQVFSDLLEKIMRALAGPGSPQQRILAYAGAHFDYIAENQLYPRIVLGEMTRMRLGKPHSFGRITMRYFTPLFQKLAELLRDGQKTGEFRAVDPEQFVPSMIAVIVFYFNSAPIMKLMSGKDPFSPERLAVRRAAVLDFISAALFCPSAAGKGELK